MHRQTYNTIFKDRRTVVLKNSTIATVKKFLQPWCQYHFFWHTNKQVFSKRVHEMKVV